MKTKVNTKSLVILGLMTALTMIFSFTPIGSIPIGPLVITLNVIPIAIAAVRPCGKCSHWRSFRTAQLFAVLRNRRAKRNGCSTCCDRSGPGFRSAICTKTS